MDDVDVFTATLDESVCSGLIEVEFQDDGLGCFTVSAFYDCYVGQNQQPSCPGSPCQVGYQVVDADEGSQTGFGCEDGGGDVSLTLDNPIFEPYCPDQADDNLELYIRVEANCSFAGDASYTLQYRF